jgi:hypothetical protein
MRGKIVSLVTVLLFVAPAWAGEEPHGKIVLNLWDAAFLPGGQAGYVHTSVQEIERDGKKIYRTTTELRLKVRRFDKVIPLRMDTGTDETPQGKVVGVFLNQYPGTETKMSITGSVQGKQLRLVLNGTKPQGTVPWDDRVIGMYRQLRLLRDRRAKPGDAFNFLSYEAAVHKIIRTDVTVKDYEEVPLQDGKKARLLRVEIRPEKIDQVQLPTSIVWYDKDYTPLRSQVDVPGLGLMTLYRTSRELALGEGAVVRLTDIGFRNFVRLRQRINDPYNTRTAVYRITVKGEDEPGTTFTRDRRQQVKNVKGNRFELHVRSIRGPQGGLADKELPKEFIQSSYFINSADGLVKLHARRAVGDEEDSWRKALKIEQWVHKHMKSEDDEALAPADQVARTLKGDCTEYAMLMAAMCRAEGVPSRTALGLVYANVDKHGPVFAFHMWTEVWVRGQWVPLDATLGQGYVGATHLKITDHSWHDTRSMTPLLPVLRVLGKLSIEVVSAGGE